MEAYVLYTFPDELNRFHDMHNTISWCYGERYVWVLWWKVFLRNVYISNILSNKFQLILLVIS